MTCEISSQVAAVARVSDNDNVFIDFENNFFYQTPSREKKWTEYVQGTQDKVPDTCVRRTLGLSVPLGTSVCHPSPRIRVRTAQLEVGKKTE
jgi:hypothetical protein